MKFRLTKCIDSHLLDNGILDKEYDLNDEIELNDYSSMDIPKAVYNKLGYVEDIMEEYNIESVEKFKKIIKYKDEQLKKYKIENLEYKLKQLYLELYITRLQYIHKYADEYDKAKERFGIEDLSLSSVWSCLTLQQYNECSYENLCELERGIRFNNDNLFLNELEHEIKFKKRKTEEEIFKEIKKIENKIEKVKNS